MPSLTKKLLLTTACICAVLCLPQPRAAYGQVTTRIYRGSVGGSHIEMRLKINGGNVTGSYSYDRIGQEIKVSGLFNSQGVLALIEADAKGKLTGIFGCHRPLGEGIDSDCTWSRPDGTGRAYVTLEEQHFAFTNGLRIVPKVTINRKTGVNVSYPQLTGGSGTLAAACEAFNRRVADQVAKGIIFFMILRTP